MQRTIALTVGLVMAWVGPAAADYTEIAPVRPLTLIDPSGLTLIGIDTQLTTWSIPAPPPIAADFTAVTFDVTADIKVAPHWVLVGRLPLSHVSVDPEIDVGDDCCELALGNLTLGGRGLWSTLHANGTRSVAGGELAIGLPTASSDGDRGVSAGEAAFAYAPIDPGRYAPNTTTIRFDLFGQLYGQRFMAQAQLGGQLYFFGDEAGGGEDLALHVGLATGVRLSYRLALLLELQAMLSDEGRFGEDDFSALDLGVRYGSDRGVFGARIYLPLDGGLRDLDMLGVGLDAGLRF
jgi:hypothetical protein